MHGHSFLLPHIEYSKAPEVIIGGYTKTNIQRQFLHTYSRVLLECEAFAKAMHCASSDLSVFNTCINFFLHACNLSLW